MRSGCSFMKCHSCTLYHDTLNGTAGIRVSADPETMKRAAAAQAAHMKASTPSFFWWTHGIIGPGPLGLKNCMRSRRLSGGSHVVFWYAKLLSSPTRTDHRIYLMVSSPTTPLESYTFFLCINPPPPSPATSTPASRNPKGTETTLRGRRYQSNHHACPRRVDLSQPTQPFLALRRPATHHSLLGHDV